ncbi:MAG: hypothetical protein LBL61_02540 [Elusimicrobiota bacterium]|jgi:hypothetical protein|nr:hypothetical protein [Elusimicrobiota bacterium]
MRKIRKFKVAMHLKEILRRVKLSQADIKAAGFPDDRDLAVFTASLHRALEPGVVYEFMEGHCMELASAGIENDGVLGVCALTLGSKIEEEINQIVNPQALAIANIILYEFLRTAVIFAASLIKDDAEKEDFTVGGYEVLYSPSFSYGPEPKFLREAARVDAQAARKALGPLFERLNAQKINVQFENDAVSPKATIVFIMPWLAKKRKK